MNRTTGLAFAAAAFAMAATSMVTGASAQQRGVTPTEVVFGMPTDLSGPAATYGVSSSNGVKMRFEEINEQGGIFGRKLKVIIEDQGYQVPNYPENPQDAAQKAIRTRYEKVLGSAVNPALRASTGSTTVRNAVHGRAPRSAAASR